ncbi:MAG: tetratricopeptide repeat protein [Bacteroides sp.]|nr:tetratricopeptide repeat protein [Bacteroides sp.]
MLSSCSAVLSGVVAGAVTPLTTHVEGKKSIKKRLIGRKLTRPALNEEQQRKYDYYYLEAARLKVQRQYDAAFDMLQHCLSINPYASSALYEVAQYYLYLKENQQGLAALEKAVQYAPDNYWYSQGLANLYMQLKEEEKAIALLQEMTVRFPGKLDPYYNLLDIYNHREEYDQVIAVLDKIEERSGKSEQLSMEKFRIYRQKQDKESAFREIESLVAEYPMDLRYQVVLGDAYMQDGRQEEAYTIYNKVLAEEPDNALAMYSLASYYEQTNQKEKYEQQLDALLLNKKVDSETKFGVMRQVILQNQQADQDSTRIIALFDRIMEQEPDDIQLPMLYAQYLISKGMDKESLPVLQQVLDIDPTNTAARMTLLGEAVRKEDYQEVTRLCEAGVESNPEKLEFYYYLAISYNQAERTDDLIAICRKALTHITPNSNKEVVSDFYTILGDAYHSKGMNPEAYSAYDEALRYNPDNIGALNNYAYFLSVERRDLDKAEEMSYKTVKAEPGNSTYLDTYAWILFEKGNYAEARIYIDEAMKNKGGESDVVVEHCGDIHYMTGDVEGALKYWKQALEMGSKSETLKKKIQRKKYIAE